MDVDEIVERLGDMAAKRETLASDKRPTIAELEAILAQPDTSPVEILPNGEIRAGGERAAEAATLREAVSELARLQAELAGARALTDAMNRELRVRIWIACKTSKMKDDATYKVIRKEMARIEGEATLLNKDPGA